MMKNIVLINGTSECDFMTKVHFIIGLPYVRLPYWLLLYIKIVLLLKLFWIVILIDIVNGTIISKTNGMGEKTIFFALFSFEHFCKINR